MTPNQMKIFTRHMDKYFEQSDCYVLHPLIVGEVHIDVLLYKPTKKYPFWKMVTMGASDYKMPPIKNSISPYNEYIMFVDATEDLSDMETVSWYHNKLMTIALYPYSTGVHITYGHSLEWKNDDPSDEMVAAFIEFPQVVEDTGILRCKLGLTKTVACLQTVLLNRGELEKLLQIGPQAFSEYLYPENGDRGHFISEKHRSAKF